MKNVFMISVLVLASFAAQAQTQVLKIAPTVGKLNFYKCSASWPQKGRMMLGGDKKAILNELIAVDQCSFVTDVDYKNAVDFMQSEQSMGSLLMSPETVPFLISSVGIKGYCDAEDYECLNNQAAGYKYDEIYPQNMAVTIFSLSPAQFKGIQTLVTTANAAPPVAVSIFFLENEARFKAGGSETEGKVDIYGIEKSSIVVK